MKDSRSITAQDIPEDELREEFLCTAAGPGGQHVNRTANTVRLFFDPAASSLLTPGAQNRLKKAAGTDEKSAGRVAASPIYKRADHGRQCAGIFRTGGIHT